MKLLHCLIKSEKGSVAVEMAWVGIFMSMMMIALVDFSDIMYSSMKLSAGVGACVPYAIQNPTDSAGISTVLQRSSNLDASKLTVNVNEFCECDGQAAECDAVCTAGIEKYVTLSSTFSRPLMFNYPGLDNPYVLEKNQTVRIQ